MQRWLVVTVSLTLCNAGFAEIMHLSSERTTYARAEFRSGGMNQSVEDIDWADAGSPEFHGFSEVVVPHGDGVITARSWQDSLMAPDRLTARIRHEITQTANAPATVFAETYPGFIVEFMLTEPSRAEFSAEGRAESIQLMRGSAGLISGSFNDDGPRPVDLVFGWEQSSDATTRTYLDLDAGVHTLFFTVFARTALRDEGPGVQSWGDARVTLRLIPEPTGLAAILLAAGIGMGLARRR